MTLTVEWGWWVLPTLLTVLVWGAYFRYCIRRESWGQLDFGFDILFFFLAAFGATSFFWAAFFGSTFFLR